MISVKKLKKSFHGVEVLKGIDAEIDRGEVVCVIGPSGSGKSTFLRCLNLLEKPTEGHIFFEGDDLTDPKINLNLHRQKMGMVFQQFNLFPHMSIMENLTCAPVMLKKMTKEQAQNKALELLGKVGLQDRAQDYPRQLSGGQQQTCDDKLLNGVCVCAGGVEYYNALLGALVDRDIIYACARSCDSEEVPGQLHLMHGSGAYQDSVRILFIVAYGVLALVEQVGAAGSDLV